MIITNREEILQSLRAIKSGFSRPARTKVHHVSELDATPPHGYAYLRFRDGDRIREVQAENFFTFFGMEEILDGVQNNVGSGTNAALRIMLFDSTNVPPLPAIQPDEYSIDLPAFAHISAIVPSPVFDDNGPLWRFGAVTMGTFPQDHTVVGVGMGNKISDSPLKISVISYVALSQPEPMTANLTFLDLIYQLRMERIL